MASARKRPGTYVQSVVPGDNPGDRKRLRVRGGIIYKRGVCARSVGAYLAISFSFFWNPHFS
ncbi:hypothetical protein BD309DRAFT_948598 [Dichomitus squalens]|nr:hypothetical protein BD309DRAFT_948598 [Dichomitus squalens]